MTVADSIEEAERKDRRIFILVEGVNIYATVLDTDQLSVIRGGSFLLKRAIEEIALTFDRRLNPLSTGASSGLFSVTDTGAVDGPLLVDEIRRHLQKHPQFRHFCFMVEWWEADSVQLAKEVLLAKVRFRQLRSITAAPDPDEPQSAGPCQLEGVRMLAATGVMRKVGGQDKAVSESICQRLKFGREQRGSYYENELKAHAGEMDDWRWLDSYRFTKDIEALAKSRVFTRLTDKIAVVYLDGNGFGGIQRTLIRQAGRVLAKEIEAQKNFDKEIKRYRARFLGDLLKRLRDSEEDSLFFPNAKVILKSEKAGIEDEKGPAFRLETLLWGGDEMLFVVPAWLGVDLLQLFYQISADWKIKRQPLTHAGGVVFCNAKTPIRIVRRLAQELAERVKASPDGRAANRFDYLVLESIDYPAETSLADFFSIRYGAIAKYRQPLRPSPGWTDHLKASLTEAVQKDTLPRRPIYRMAEALTRGSLAESFYDPGAKGVGWTHLSAEGNPPEGMSAFERMERRMLDTADNRKQLLEKIIPVIFNLFGSDRDDQRSRAWAWLHLVELWDYLIPLPEEAPE